MESRSVEFRERAHALQVHTASLHEELSCAPAEQNSLPPINRAPDDILAALFLHVIASSKADHKDWSYEIVKISHVCRRWHAVAIGFPTLWADIRMGIKHQRTTIFLSRAGGAQISLFKELYAQEIVSDIQYIDRYIHRIHRLRLQISSHSKMSDRPWPEHFASPATSLKDLEIKFLGDPRCSVFTKGTRIFGGATPALRSLTLVYLSFPSASPLFQNLTRLHLEGAHVLISCRDLLGIAQRCPGLEQLTLIQMSGSALDIDDVSAVKVELPHLTDLRLQWAGHLVTRLLPQFVLPPTTAVCIDLYANDQGTQLRPTALPALSTVHHIQYIIDFCDYEPHPWECAATCSNHAGDTVLWMRVMNMDELQLAAYLDHVSTIGRADATTAATVLVQAGFFGLDRGWSLQSPGVSFATELRVLPSPTYCTYGRSVRSEQRVDLFTGLANHRTWCAALKRLRYVARSDEEDDAAFMAARQALAMSRPELSVEFHAAGCECGIHEWE